MTFVVTENCIACKYTDCVDSCPVDCFHAGENMLVINPDLCIDCGVCVPECPADAICADTAPEAENWIAFNKQYSKYWPIIYQTTEPMPQANEMEGVSNKFKTHFSEQPAA